MASLRRFPGSKFWYACFTLPDGRRVQRSTKETGRKAAQALADEWQKLADGRAKAKQAHRVIADIYRAAHAAELPGATTRGFFGEWLDERKNEVSPATFAAYSHRARQFLDFLGTGADRPLTEVSSDDVRRFRDKVRKDTSASTATHALKILRIFFAEAERRHLLHENPAKAVKTLDKEDTTRRPFTVEQIRRLLEVASDEWRSLIVFGLYTGQRLGDIVRLTWAHVDFEADEVRLRTRKTGRVVAVPMSPPLRRHVEALRAASTDDGPLHPDAFQKLDARGSVSPLSRAFSDLMADAGLAERRDHAATDAGHGGARKRSELSFHSLRQSATSLMKNAGISPAVVQDIIGHESAEISAHYTTIEAPTKRRALESLPDLLA